MLATCEPVTKGIRLKKLLMLPSDESLGGVHSSQVRKLLLQKLRQENETLRQPRAVSFDFRFAETEAYYYRRHQETVLGEAWKYKMVPGPPVHREEVKEFERVTAYPIAHPYQETLLEVTILTEKAKKEEEVKKPLCRELLSMPFLRSQLEKIKV
ncbi:Hypothetical predicted protein [Lynx pardinus]|uniref:Uncharacterized protein n=1 Tax=Lynx pardinus TaxID=191816 RepID=A0A485PAK6_LYNPA|nr:Hypothetical predicted protein [Lynx pardinus]